MPNVNRASPLNPSMPTNPSARPMKRLVSPARSDGPSSAHTITNASTMRAKYSAGPNTSARRTSAGAASDSANVESVPATNDPMAAVERAAPPRPDRAMAWPSIAVTIVALSPGVLSRIELVDPPYIAP
jgi:hypothetical protein